MQGSYLSIRDPGDEKAKVGNRRNDMGIVVRLGSASGFRNGRKAGRNAGEGKGMGTI